MRRLLLVVPSVVLLCWAALLFVYRLPSGAPEAIEGEVLYKHLDFSSDLRTTIFEAILNNRRVYLVDGRQLYVNSTTFKKVWAENPHQMAEQGRTKYIVAEVRPLLFGGYGLAAVSDIRSIAKPAETRK